MTRRILGLCERNVAAALEEAVRAARDEEVSIVAAVVDAGGTMAGLLRMPGAFLASNDHAEWKAWTAASFAMTTREFDILLRGLEAMIREELLAHPRTTSLPGGVPILRDGHLAGAVGVSGGSGEQDHRFALAAAAAAAGQKLPG